MTINPPNFTYQSVATSLALNNGFQTVTTEINRLAGWLPAGQQNPTNTSSGTTAANANTMVLRDPTNAGAYFGTLGVTIPSATAGGIGIVGFGGMTAQFLNVVASTSGNDGAGGTAFAIGAAKTVFIGGAMTVAAGGMAVTGASTIAGNLTLTGNPNVLTAPQIVAPINTAGQLSLVAKNNIDVTPRKIVSLQDTAAEHGFLSSDGSAQFTNMILADAAKGNFPVSALVYAAYVYSASPPSLVVNVAPGAIWNGNTWVENPNGGSITYGGGGANPALPAVRRIDMIGFNASNQIAVITSGSDSSTPTPAALPPAFTPLAYISIRAGATQIFPLGTVDTGTLSIIYKDIRAHVANPSGIGASGTFAPLASSFITDINEVTSANNLSGSKQLGSVLGGVSGVTVGVPAGIAGPLNGPSLIRSGYRSNIDFDAALSNIVRNRVSFNLQTNPNLYLKKASGNQTMQLVPGVGDPIAVDANGTWRVVGTTIATPSFVGNASGAYWIYADCTVAGPGFTLNFAPNTSKPAPNSGFIPLCRVYWDNANAVIQDELIDYSPLGYAPLFDSGSGIFGPYVFTKTDATATTMIATAVNVPTYQGTMALATQKTIYLPRAAKVLVTGSVRVTQGPTPSQINVVAIAPVFNGSTINWPVSSLTFAATGYSDQTGTLPEYGFLIGISAVTITITAFFVTPGGVSNPSSMVAANIPIMTASFLKATVL